VILSFVRISLVIVGASLLAAPAAVARRDPNSPSLHPVASDVRAAKTLLLRRSTLGSSFHASPSGTTANHNSGSCAGFDPNLRALTETAEVYGDLLLDRREGLLFTSEAETYLSPAEAVEAQTLETAPGAGRCVASLAKKAAGERAVILKKKLAPIGFIAGALQARGWDAELLVRTSGHQVPVEATLIVYRLGRAVSALVGEGVETRSAARYSREASAEMVAALLHANLR
jgi:hypothetical protein